MTSTLKRKMMSVRTWFLALVLAVTIVSGPPVLGAAPPRTYATVETAKQHCPADVVVWINTKTGVYHYPGQRWFGATKQGAYACEKETPQLGARATRNGQ